MRFLTVFLFEKQKVGGGKMIIFNHRWHCGVETRTGDGDSNGMVSVDGAVNGVCEVLSAQDLPWVPDIIVGNKEGSLC